MTTPRLHDLAKWVIRREPARGALSLIPRPPGRLRIEALEVEHPFAAQFAGVIAPNPADSGNPSPSLSGGTITTDSENDFLAAATVAQSWKSLARSASIVSAILG